VRARKGRLDAADDPLDVGGGGVVEAAAQRSVGRVSDRPALVAQLADALGEVGAVAPRLELGERRLKGDAQLQRGLAQAPGVEVGAGAQDELLARQGASRPPSRAARRSCGRSAASRLVLVSLSAAGSTASVHWPSATSSPRP
jgi:hypothetical protein